LDDAYIPARQREHDFYIMDVVLADSSYPSSDIQRINYCRLYLQATIASDICLPSGRTIDPAMLQGIPSALSSVSLHHHTVQPCPLAKPPGQFGDAPCASSAPKRASCITPLAAGLSRAPTFAAPGPPTLALPAKFF
jgi:hypothetical protein